jgi:murein DD-endopeptidase MepM/ murein hydrolase activator NlpD
LRRTSRALTLIVAGLALSATACGAASGSSRTATSTAVAPTATPEVADLTVFRGFTYPIKGGCLPQGDQLMPNAPRAYRGGIHEGVDFYGYDNCAKIAKGTAILAAKDGTIIRADHDYQPLTEAQLLAADKRISEGHANDPDILNLFRGRQVWIDHGKGIVTRYGHTSDVAANIHVGDTVHQGDVIAFVGDSGTPESISDPGTEEHLHFELRAGDSFLGKDLPPADVRALYEHLFSPLGAP